MSEKQLLRVIRHPQGNIISACTQHELLFAPSCFAYWYSAPLICKGFYLHLQVSVAGLETPCSSGAAVAVVTAGAGLWEWRWRKKWWRGCWDCWMAEGSDWTPALWLAWRNWVVALWTEKAQIKRETVSGFTLHICMYIKTTHKWPHTGFNSMQWLVQTSPKQSMWSYEVQS